MFLDFETIITIRSCRPGGSLGIAVAVPQSLRPYEFSALSLLLRRGVTPFLLLGRWWDISDLGFLGPFGHHHPARVRPLAARQPVRDGGTSGGQRPGKFARRWTDR